MVECQFQIKHSMKKQSHLRTGTSLSAVTYNIQYDSRMTSRVLNNKIEQLMQWSGGVYGLAPSNAIFIPILTTITTTYVENLSR